ncbi:hypothetical protein [Paenibacillus bovis]|uniref:Uncharacterized protein n=1 Tax=Paenibacillus bovis TaxID=1616788 RepID=A0A172ZFL0_9BACL|nr:hypothetical protein [Paenibacillus bovis]ANF96415.1 hypothetical protein AR543_10630 [Paenibacillus bovis]
MKSKLLRITVLGIVAVIALTFIYYSGIQRIEGIYQVVGVTNKGIIIQSGSEEHTIRTTPDIMALIQMDHFYDIQYEKKPLQEPTLNYIRPRS